MFEKLRSMTKEDAFEQSQYLIKFGEVDSGISNIPDFYDFESHSKEEFEEFRKRIHKRDN